MNHARLFHWNYYHLIVLRYSINQTPSSVKIIFSMSHNLMLMQKQANKQTTQWGEGLLKEKKISKGGKGVKSLKDTPCRAQQLLTQTKLGQPGKNIMTKHLCVCLFKTAKGKLPMESEVCSPNGCLQKAGSCVLGLWRHICGFNYRADISKNALGARLTYSRIKVCTIKTSTNTLRSCNHIGVLRTFKLRAIPIYCCVLPELCG